MKSYPIILAFAVATQAVSAYEISSVKVSGEKQAQIQFVGSQASKEAPVMQIKENVVELVFRGAELASQTGGKVDLVHPHALIQSISVFRPEKSDSVKARLVLNGSAENLKTRAQLGKNSGGFGLAIAFPEGNSEELTLFKEEQLPVLAAAKEVTAKSDRIPAFQFILSIIIIGLAAGAAYFAVRFLKQKGGLKGNRKFLIEQLSYFPLGPKSGVSLIKVGTEFVLVGVTPQQITYLSTLPKLQQQYEDESRFERGVFREAVEQEFQKNTAGVSA